MASLEVSFKPPVRFELTTYALRTQNLVYADIRRGSFSCGFLLLLFTTVRQNSRTWQQTDHSEHDGRKRVAMMRENEVVSSDRHSEIGPKTLISSPAFDSSLSEALQEASNRQRRQFDDLFEMMRRRIDVDIPNWLESIGWPRDMKLAMQIALKEYGEYASRDDCDQLTPSALVEFIRDVHSMKEWERKKNVSAELERWLTLDEIVASGIVTVARKTIDNCLAKPKFATFTPERKPKTRPHQYRLASFLEWFEVEFPGKPVCLAGLETGKN